MTRTNILLYAATVLIWGSTWYAITFQFGVVAPEVSVVYRFALAAAVLFAWCAHQGRSLRFRARDHVFLVLLGLGLFSTNYVLVYLATLDLNSGLVAVAFSTIVLMNVINTAWLFSTPIDRRICAAGVVGLAGIALVFWPEVAGAQLSGRTTTAILTALTATLIASFGNMVATRNHHHGMPVFESTAWAMAYGAGLVAAYAWWRGLPFNFDPRPAYLWSLAYLVLFGSVAAFGAYLTLLGRIGASRASYAAVLFPVVALTISTAFEGYRWTALAAAGVALVTAGNVLALSRALKNPFSLWQRNNKQGAGKRD